MLDKCWPLSRLRESSDVSRMPDDDRGQLCIPCWANSWPIRQLVGKIGMIGNRWWANNGDWPALLG